jgi:hypothetical protein
MHDTIAGDDERKLLMQVVAQYEAPAYIRRARQVEVACEAVIERCRRQRSDWLAGVRLHLKALDAAGNDVDLRRTFGAATMAAIELLRSETGLKRQPVEFARLRSLRSLLRYLRWSVARFNRRWSAFLDQFDLSELNALRDGYNRYYLLEKECAVGSIRLAAMTYRRLEPMTHRELHDHFAPLREP